MSSMSSNLAGFSAGDVRTEQLNNRLYDRNVPSAPLQMQFSVRPVNTKYTQLAILDHRKVATEPIRVQAPYNTQYTFNPGNAEGPWNGYALNVNDESRLRNQFYALQKSDQAAYVPPSTSDLYNETVSEQTSSPMIQPFPDLFYQPTWQPFNPNQHANLVGNWYLNNCTRQQLKNVSV